jgi:hypothetical protein
MCYCLQACDDFKVQASAMRSGLSLQSFKNTGRDIFNGQRWHKFPIYEIAKWLQFATTQYGNKL